MDWFRKEKKAKHQQQKLINFDQILQIYANIKKENNGFFIGIPFSRFLEKNTHKKKFNDPKQMKKKINEHLLVSN